MSGTTPLPEEPLRWRMPAAVIRRRMRADWREIRRMVLSVRMLLLVLVLLGGYAVVLYLLQPRLAPGQAFSMLWKGVAVMPLLGVMVMLSWFAEWFSCRFGNYELKAKGIALVGYRAGFVRWRDVRAFELESAADWGGAKALVLIVKSGIRKRIALPEDERALAIVDRVASRLQLAEQVPEEERRLVQWVEPTWAYEVALAVGVGIYVAATAAFCWRLGSAARPYFIAIVCAGTFLGPGLWLLPLWYRARIFQSAYRRIVLYSLIANFLVGQLMMVVYVLLVP